MQPLNQKTTTIERVVSQKALQMGSSFPCQICVAGFLCGVCLTSLFLAALTSFGTFQLGPISFSTMSMANSSGNSTSHDDISRRTECNFKVKEAERLSDLKSSSTEGDEDERVSLLYSAWSAMLTKSKAEGNDYLKIHGISGSSLPSAPHLENCEAKTRLYGRLDKRSGNESFPPWTTWKGFLDAHPIASTNEQIKNLRHQAVSEGAYPPWIAGSDEENYPLTRKVQRDIWIHQHPLNCRDPGVKFLVADWERLPGFGIGAQIAGMCGLLAIAISEGRVLVTNYYNRADHDGCKGSSQSSWSCYFFPETSVECHQRAFELMKEEEALTKGIVTMKENYTSKHIWTGPTPRKWGVPWNYLQPTTDINGSLLASHRKMDRRWWRAQAVRYLMRFPTEYTCNLLNEARQAAFGKLAAKMVLGSLAGDWPKEESIDKPRSDIDEYVWSNHKPWIPRPLLSMHVRMGDKACEMKVVEFEGYMQLADRIRRRFPNLNNIWLSTEMQQNPLRLFVICSGDTDLPETRCAMCKLEEGDGESSVIISQTQGHPEQISKIEGSWDKFRNTSKELGEVIDKTRKYSHWNFHYTKIKRQVRSNMSMAEYEASLGRETSTNYPLVNFLMAADSDFFVGALGSTWSFLIDGMRSTGGKVMAGYLSVNKDRFW